MSILSSAVRRLLSTPKQSWLCVGHSHLPPTCMAFILFMLQGPKLCELWYPHLQTYLLCGFIVRVALMCINFLTYYLAHYKTLCRWYVVGIIILPKGTFITLWKAEVFNPFPLIKCLDVFSYLKPLLPLKIVNTRLRLSSYAVL